MNRKIKKYQKITYLITWASSQTPFIVKSIRSQASPQKDWRTSIIVTNLPQDADVSLVSALRSMKCILTHKDITAIKLPWPSQHSTLFRYLLLSGDKVSGFEKNTCDALSLTRLYREKFAIEIYSLSPGQGPCLLFDSIDKGQPCGKIPPVKIRRVHFARNLIYQNLYKHSLFELACNDHGEQVITVIIIGMDAFGSEMLKACLWCGQMDGFVLKVHVIDSDPKAQERFYYMAPEVAARNKLPRSGEDYYEVTFHSGISYQQIEFPETLRSIKNPSWVLVSCGSDSANLETAIKTREIYAQEKLREEYIPTHYPSSKQSPFIQAIIKNDDIADLLNRNQLKNYRDQAYDINALGNNSSLYSISNICDPKFEEMALKTHLRWGDEYSFHNHEYNRRASLASAIHKKYRDKLYPEDNILKDILEHKRWNAYMRSSEGYSFGLTRDDLAKQHNDLIPFDELSQPEKRKDSVMSRR